MSAIHTIRTELRYLVRELGLLDKNCFRSGLSLTQAHLLTYLSKNGVTSFAELCLQLSMDKASLSRTLNVLAGKNYVEPVAGVKDKRQKSFQLTAAGARSLATADDAADNELSFIDNAMALQDAQEIINGLRALRINTFRRNAARHPQRIQIEIMRSNYLPEVTKLLTETFAQEQNIPAELISLPPQLKSQCWIVRSGEYVLGTVSCWYENNQWHWGRFAVNPCYRGMGIGKQLARVSLQEMLEQTDKVLLDARDSTVKIISDLGGIITGPTTDFYGMPITPMRLKKEDFQNATA
ncbi:GNAT family N-acetyltransferase (plasmid) [Rahnella variigena]|uniref:GNAT family N-acetyltransferase n=1 Tax=Rahnella TaxID=34037 RepID=UPI000DD4CBBA|nr:MULTISPECIES: GNAT family N-acetyltransferase [Rahnella]MDH2894572.1 GNAT family N-acetyltransferase [Rahnella variigena]